MYALFNNLEEFNYWHSQIKESLGYPLTCYRADGSIIPGSVVEEYTQPIVHPVTGFVIAPYGDDVVPENSITHEEAIALGYLSPPEEREE
jgi:hypothetical protein